MAKTGKAVVNDYFIVLGAQLISAPLSILYLSLVSRIMGPGDYGRFALFLGATQFFFCLFINWMRNASIRFGTEEFTKFNKISDIFCVQSVILIASASLSLMSVLIFKEKIASFIGLGNGIHLFLIMFLIAYAISDFFAQFLLATHQIKRYGVSIVIRQCFILAMVIFVFMQKRNLTPFTLVYIELASFLIVALFVAQPFIRGSYLNAPALKKDLFSDVFVYTWPIALHVIMSYFLLWADSLLIRTFLDFASVGKYEIANRLIQYVSNLIMPISIISFPIAVSIKSSGREDLIFKYAQRIVPQISFFWSIFIIFLLILSKHIFNFIFGSQYNSSILIFNVLLMGLSFQILSVLYTSLLQSYDLNKTLLFITAITVCVNLAGDLLLIPRIGILGASISKAASLTLCGLLYMSKAIIGVRVKGNSYRYSLFFLIFPLLLLGLFTIFDKAIARLLFTLAAFAILYLTAKNANIFNKTDVELVQQLQIPDYLKTAIQKIYRRLS